MGLVGPRAPCTLTPLTGGVSSDIFARRRRRPDLLRQAGAAQSSRWPPTGARRSSATASEAEWIRVASARSCPDAVPAAARPRIADAGLFAMAVARAGRRIRCGRRSCATATIEPAFAAEVGRRSRASMRRPRARRDIAAASRPTTSSSRSGSSPTCSATARAASGRRAARCGARRGAPRARSSRSCTATSARRTSWSGRAARCSSTPSAPGTATRPSTSPSASTTCCSSACGQPQWRAALPRLLRRAGAAPISRGVDWEPRRRSRRGPPRLLPGLFLARVDGKSPVEYITATTTASGCASVRAAAARRTRRGRSAGGGRGAGEPDAGAPMMARRGDRRPCTAAGSGTRADGRRSRPRSTLAGGARGPRHRARRRLARRARGGRPARRRRAASAAWTSTRAVAARERRDRRARSRAWTRATRPAVDAALIALDGTPNKSRLGGNAMIAVSLAVLHAAAAAAGRAAVAPTSRRARRCALPLPEIQIFGGGAHAGRRVDVQDFMVMPLGAAQLRRGARDDRRGLPRRRRADGATPASSRASPTRAACGRRSTPTRRRSTGWCARSSAPAYRPGEEVGDLARHRRLRVRPRRPLPARPRGARARHATA